MNFEDALKSCKVLLLDGAMGTMLQAAGMPAGISPDEFCLKNPEILASIHNQYIEAGADAITTCTFGANPFKLPEQANVFSINRELAKIARNCADRFSERKIFVLGDVGPGGFFAKPMGDVDPEKMIDAYEAQIRGLYEGGVDAILIETQFDLAETRLAVVAAKKCGKLPVLVSMTFEDGRSLTGSTPEIYAETMQNQCVSVIGTNCSLGPDEMRPVVSDLLSVCQTPVLVQPNAGLPVLKDGKTVFPLGPEQFAAKTAKFAEMGARLVGGCCGTTPAHIHALAMALKKITPGKPEILKRTGITLTSRTRIVRMGEDNPLTIIGERINPTGKPALAKELQEGRFSLALEMAAQQIENGAKVLDVNVGAPLVDEQILLPALVCELIQRFQVPLSIDSPDKAAIAASLPFWPGSCLVNSINAEKDRMEIIGPLCRDFGCPFILLPLSGAQLPETAKERIGIAEKLLEKADMLGIPKRLIIVDILALAVSTTSRAARECLKMLEWCRANGLASTIGLSNISFGLPARSLLNSVFLSLARGAGLSSCIANPGIETIKQTVDSINALEGGSLDSFIEKYASWKQGETVKTAASRTESKTLFDCILFGDKENMRIKLEEELKNSKEPLEIINEILVPAINEVGEKYGRKEYFLPQLIRSAETMKEAFEELSPILKKQLASIEKPKIVLATVEGDIHDIGKNIVALLLGNHGFEVIDAGKDVPAAKIVRIAEENNAFLIGLSALMTTTMTRMEDTVKLVKEKKLPIRVIVGGAAVTSDFAELIGADAYCETAVDSVKAAKMFMRNSNSH